jgi:peptide/nickel transport system substrate-binding protein
MASAPVNRAPIGNGPFRFVEYRPNERWVFEANPDFPEELGGRPWLDRVVWRVIPDPTAEVTELQTGAVDLALAVRAEDYHRLDEQPDLRGTVRESRQYAFVAWNTRRPPLDDPRVRLALTMAIDREEMIEVLRAGYGQPAIGPIGPYHWSFASDLGAPPFAPDSARALLAAAGLRDGNGDGVLERPDGSPVTADLEYVATSGYQRDVAEMIQSDLAEVGIRIAPTPLDWNTIIGGITSPGRDFDAVVMGWETDFRLNLRDTFHSAALAGPYQFAGYSSPEVDSLIEASMLLADRDRARPLLHRLQEIMRDEQPWGFLYYFPDLYVMRDRLRGVHMDIRGTLVNLPEWWVLPPAGTPSDSAGRAPSQGEERTR